jgi:hypothetical protein
MPRRVFAPGWFRRLWLTTGFSTAILCFQFENVTSVSDRIAAIPELEIAILALVADAVLSRRNLQVS